MATFQEDVDRLATDLAAQQVVIGQVAAANAANVQAIADLKAQIAVLQGQGVDTTALEAQIGILETNTSNLSGLVTPPTA